MKTLKLIVLMLLTANFVMAQFRTTSLGTDAGEIGSNNTHIGELAGRDVNLDDNTFVGMAAGIVASGATKNVGVGRDALQQGGTKNTAIGFQAALNVTGTSNTFIGADAGYNAGTIRYSVGIGSNALGSGSGLYNVAIGSASAIGISGDYNTFIGGQAGRNAAAGNNNTGIGYAALNNLTQASNNLAIGNSAGVSTTTGDNNLFIGANAGKDNTTGSLNTYLGELAGSYNNGSRNVFIGFGAGSNSIVASASNQLYIQNSTDVTTPLIYGDFATKQLGIGTSHVPTDPDTGIAYTLAVNGKTLTEEVQVMVRSTWPDYVFAEDYNLMSLTDLETEIETLGHLPGVPSAEEVEAKGHALGRMDAILLEKVEELTLHLIDMNKEIKDLRQENNTLKNEIKILKK